MSGGLMAYSVDIPKALASCGSRDEELRRAICERYRDSIERTNNNLECSNDEGEPSIFEAIRNLIMGEEKTFTGELYDLTAMLYGYGLEYIVEYFGEPLNNNLFFPADWEFLTNEVGEEMKHAGAIVVMENLFTKSPIPLPKPEDYPNYGHWTAADVAASVEPLRNCKNPSEELQAITKWLEFAADRKEGIIGYYY